MTDEIKTNIDDAKDFASQAKLEVKKSTRNAEVSATKTVAHAAESLGLESHRHNQADIVGLQARTTALNALDTTKQVGIEVQKQTRDAKLAFDHSTAGQKINAAAAATADAASSAVETVKDAVLPSEKVIEQTSTRGIDITSVQNPRNDQIPAERAAIAAKEAAAADREKEIERQKVLAATKASIAEKTESARAVLSQIGDKAEILLGKAAVSAKEAIDGLMQEQKPMQVETKTSANGVDISSVSNVHNEELLAREQRLKELEAAKQPTIGDKVADTLSKAGAAIKGAYTEATTEAPQPIITSKVSEGGVDISSAANPANEQLAAEEQKRLSEQKARDTAREKALVEQQVKDGLVDPAAAKAGEAKDDLSAKFSALGQSISAAAHKIGDQISSKYEELVNPVPVDVHEKVSNNGIDTTSIANANNHVLGEQIKQQQAAGGLGAAIAPTKEQAIAQAGVSAAAPTPAAAAAAAVAPDTETAVIKGSLDGGVAARDSKHQIKATASSAKVELKTGAANLKDELILAGHDIATDIKATADKISTKIDAATK